MWKNQKGNITVFLCIVLAALIPLTFILIDLTRLRMAFVQADGTVKDSLNAMLAAYNRQLKEQYGLFALSPREEADWEKNLYELLSDNLNTGSAVEGTADLYGFTVQSVKVETRYNLSRPLVLEKQAAEFMKYRAPVQVIGEFYAKLKAMGGLLKDAETVSDKIYLDKLLNQIREESVYLWGLYTEKMPSVNRDGHTTRLRQDVMGKVALAMEGALEADRKAKEAMNGIVPILSEYNSSYAAYKSAEALVQQKQDEVSSLERRVSNRESAYERANQKVRDLENTPSASPLALERAKEDAEKARGELDEAKDELYYSRVYLSRQEDNRNLAYEKYSPLKEKMDGYVSVLSNITPSWSQNAQRSLSELNRLRQHLKLHKAYQEEALKLVDSIIPVILIIQEEIRKIRDAANARQDSSAVEAIEAKVDSLHLDLDISRWEAMKANLQNNLSSMALWSAEVENACSSLEAFKNRLDALTGAVKEYATTQTASSLLTQALQILEMSYCMESTSAVLQNLTDSAAMAASGHYRIPEYTLSPAASEAEKQAFAKWYYEHFFSLDSGGVLAPSEEDPRLNEIRGSLGGLVKAVSEDEKEEEAGKAFTEDERFLSLPSRTANSGETIAYSDTNIETGPVNESEKNGFDTQMDKTGDFLGQLTPSLGQLGEDILLELYVNEYIVSAFKSRISEDNKIKNDIGINRPLDKTFFEKGEVEYILFGKTSETANLRAAGLGVYSVRFAMNLLHVYTNADKQALALSLASALAGWTLFGIPVVQNLILVGWAGMEAYVDLQLLAKGGSVPLLKTPATWYLGGGGLVSGITDILIKPLGDLVSDTVEKKLDSAATALEETVSEKIDSVVDGALAPLEKNLNSVLDTSKEHLSDEINRYLGETGFIGRLNFNAPEGLMESLSSYIRDCVASFSETLRGEGQAQIEMFKKTLKARIKAALFQSSPYKKLLETVKQGADEAIKSGVKALGEEADKMFGGQSASADAFVGKLVMTNYTDYMRLFLLAVPDESKTLRTADLIELNLQEAASENDLSLSQYNTVMEIRVELDFKMWFLPQSLFKKNGDGMIAIEWSQGY